MSFELYSRRVKQEICTQCKTEFTSKHGETVCSKECKNKRNKITYERKKSSNTTQKSKIKICEECNEEFTQSKGASRQIYCSMPCQKIACKKKVKIRLDKERQEIQKSRKINGDVLIDSKYTKRGNISHGVNHE